LYELLWCIYSIEISKIDLYNVNKILPIPYNKEILNSKVVLFHFKHLTVNTYSEILLCFACVQYAVLVHIPLNVLNEKLISYHNKVHELWKKSNSHEKSMKIPKGYPEDVNWRTDYGIVKRLKDKRQTVNSKTLRYLMFSIYVWLFRKHLVQKSGRKIVQI
jgi:hypothetical protein